MYRSGDTILWCPQSVASGSPWPKRGEASILEGMTTDLQYRCGAMFAIGKAGPRAQVLWLVEAPDKAEGFQRADVTAAHRLHECPQCGRLLYVSSPGRVSTFVREG